jgi:hypothetical protein
LPARQCVWISLHIGHGCRIRDRLRDLRDEDRAVLDVAMEAKNMREIGITLGAWGKTAERKGKRALIAANDNIAAAIKKYVA